MRRRGVSRFDDPRDEADSHRSRVPAELTLVVRPYKESAARADKPAQSIPSHFQIRSIDEHVSGYRTIHSHQG